VRRGHEVSVVHPRHLKYPPPTPALTPYRWLRKAFYDGYSLIRKPQINWQHIDSRVKILYVPDSGSYHIPDGDAIFATGWHTVESVLKCSRSKGEKCYLIQHYEVYQGPKDLVDATWRAPIHKVVISKWLLGIGADLGCSELSYIPDAVDHERYRLVNPIEGRDRQVAMMFHPGNIKGSADGIEALKIAKKKFPDLRAVFFSTCRRTPSVPDWVDYYQNPAQEFIISDIYNKSQIFLAPSWAEGWGLPPAEAACCGCALVTTDIGGFREYMENGVTGLLSPPKDPAQLAENLCILLENGDLRQRLATAATKAIMRFDWEKSTDLLERFLIHLTPRDRSLVQPG
jgi:glycosyltransferase involved in cell wall biosynthesis